MRIAITTVQVPFVRGGAEFHAEELKKALIRAGHEVDIVSLPFKWYPASRLIDQMAAWRLMDFSTSNGVSIDKVIALKFPAWLASHPDQVIWMLHQHREAYDLWGENNNALAVDPEGSAVRDFLVEMDKTYIPRARHCFANSRNVARRLETYCGLGSRVLYHPPPGVEDLRQGHYGDYILVPARINETKRQDLVLAALDQVRTDVRVVFMGHPDRPDYGKRLREESARFGDRVRWTGFVPTAERVELYASARAVVFPPVDEDYGYGTLEAMVSAKGVITCEDSGGSLEFVEDGQTGLVVPPNPKALAAALDQLWSNISFAKQIGEAGYERYRSLNISWNDVVSCLLG